MRVRHDFDLTTRNTFALPARAETVVDIHHPADLPLLLKQNNFSDRREPKWILGGGSNLILTRDLPGTLFWLRNLGIETLYEDNDFIYWRVAAGESWQELVERSLEQGYSGLENLSLIPGTVGAAPIQNIGAYGVELKSVFVECDAIDLLTGRQKTFTHRECQLSYRDSIFKQAIDAQWLITQVTFKLNKRPHLVTQYGELKAWAEQYTQTGQPLTSAALGRRICEIRKNKLPDPKQLPSVGSFFKNPVIDQAHLRQLQVRWPNVVYYPMLETNAVLPFAFKLAAGWLLEQLGWKGYREKALGFHHQQALVMVNYGGATGCDVLALAAKVQYSVFCETGVTLEIEPKVI